MKKRYSEEQIIKVIKEHVAGAKVEDTVVRIPQLTLVEFPSKFSVVSGSFIQHTD